MDTHSNIVAAFFQLVDKNPEVFCEVENLDLLPLITALEKSENQPLEQAADEILNWSQKYDSVRDEIVSTEREKNRMGKRKPEKQDATLINTFPNWQEDIKPLDTQKQTQNQNISQTGSN